MKYRVIAQCEISRTNITPKAFYGYCKREVERRTGGKMHLTDWLDSFNDWEKPVQESEYHTEKHEDWGADARTETIKVKPFDVQWYLQGSYNFIMEFQFWDEKTGFGYLYMVETEEEPEQPTDPTEPTETETNEQEEETMYNYEEAMKNDILDYIAENIDRADYINDRDGLEEQLNDDLWTADSVTGNASGSYFCNAYRAKEAFLNDPKSEEYFSECCADFGITAEEVGKHFIRADYEWIDCTIRCYLLSSMISEVLDELEEAGYFEESETDESDIIAATREQMTA